MGSSFSSKLGRLPPLTREPSASIPERRSSELATAELATAELATAELATAELATAELATPDVGLSTPGSSRPTLDELRDRIASILSRGAPGSARAPRERYETDAASWIEHAFVETEVEGGVVYRCAKPTPLGHRVGRVAVAPAASGDPELLALLSLDPSLAGVDLARALYVDTETTGLAGGTGTVPFLVGLGAWDARAGAFVVEQLLLRTFAEEAAMIEHVRRRAEQASAIVTYNGKAFDWPLLRTRAVMNRVGALPSRPHLDLLHVVRRLHKHRLGSCSLARVEERVLGQGRVDDVAGADIAAIYFHYARTGDLAALEPVVHHNSLDVVSMFALVSLYSEPLDAWGESLDAADLSAASSVLRRAKDLDRALAFAEVGVERGAGAAGRRALAEVKKARGDKAAALLDYERALEELGDAGDEAGLGHAVRLELAKLYEHHARAFDKALAALALGTTEAPERHDARVTRVSRKLEGERTAANRAAAPRRRAPVRARPSADALARSPKKKGIG
ncbi:MAG: ribonuclease H-like domain-containing protein [Polyangiaceae bacterium]|nr:ribonuclease H-like domain-containing protein [Polyangiaceae bacterium]